MTAPTIRCACICARWARSSCCRREGEIAIAKRIEAGRELMIGALCESPLTFEALTVWRDELNEGKVLLRDIIDLEAMYGAGPDGQPANVPPPVGPDGQPLHRPVPRPCRRGRRRREFEAGSAAAAAAAQAPARRAEAPTAKRRSRRSRRRRRRRRRRR